MATIHCQFEVGRGACSTPSPAITGLTEPDCYTLLHKAAQIAAEAAPDHAGATINTRPSSFSFSDREAGRTSTCAPSCPYLFNRSWEVDGRRDPLHTWDTLRYHLTYQGVSTPRALIYHTASYPVYLWSSCSGPTPVARSWRESTTGISPEGSAPLDTAVRCYPLNQRLQ